MPMLLKTALMSHQLDAVEKVGGIRFGALFMEMGTGKSRAAIELAVRRRSKIDHTIWFCPVSLKETVRQEILKHTTEPPDAIYMFNGKTRSDTAPPALWYIVGIESMSASDRAVLAVHSLVTEKTFVIVDESSYIKGHRALRTRRIVRLAEPARYRLLLTGTPMSQGVVDLYSQFQFLHPRILGYNSFYAFERNHLEYSEKFPGLIVRSHNTGYLAAKIQPYVYQVTKEECLDLPDKIWERRYFRLTDDQEIYYDEAKEKLLADVEDWDSITIFRLFGALQQITCGFWNDTEADLFIDIRHHRIETLMDTIDDLPAGEPVIIWCKYEYDIKGIRAALSARYGDGQVCPFYGKLNEGQRNRSVQRFRDGARFFLATTSCGGHGLTLNEAAYVIFYNNSFKYSERLQAEDRCHRIGQERKVTYIDIVGACGIEDRIMTALHTKGDAVEAFKEEVNKVKDKRAFVEAL